MADDATNSPLNASGEDVQLSVCISRASFSHPNSCRSALVLVCRKGTFAGGSEKAEARMTNR